MRWKADFLEGGKTALAAGEPAHIARRPDAVAALRRRQVMHENVILAGVVIKFHELRRYFARGLITAGYNVVTVQRAMARAWVTTTLSTYAHV